MSIPMTDRLIIFSALEIRALLDGCKTQTRRLAWRDCPKCPGVSGCKMCGGKGSVPTIWQKVKPGDRLWVRETWATWMYAPMLPKGLGGELSRDPDDWLYKATATDWDDMDHDRRLLVEGNAKREDGRSGNYIIRSPIYMPRWASRLILVVTATKIERVQDISEEDAKAEGVDNNHAIRWQDDDPGFMGDVRRRNFAELWNSLHGPDAWDANPFVVALTFEIQHRNIDAMERTA